MAIKRKKETSNVAMPAEFLGQVRRAFSYQQISANYKDAFDEEKKSILTYLETNDDGVEATAGKALKTEYGSLTFKTTTYHSVDMEKIEQMIKSGEVSLTSVLALAKIDATGLKTLIGEKKFSAISSSKATESLAMSATPDFKAEVEKMFSLETGSTPVSKSAPVKVEVPKKVAPKKALSSLEKAKLAQSKSDVDSDLDAILGS